ncbi:hypothetical protein ABZ446_06420 [Streptomyces sp. NPDC005813]|uniref:hypothetical protein n=1 Tax=Streptomyces sp. NPDC005813 TaxID=3155592 RepID=UPI0033FC79BD
MSAPGGSAGTEPGAFAAGRAPRPARTRVGRFLRARRIRARRTRGRRLRRVLVAPAVVLAALAGAAST